MKRIKTLSVVALLLGSCTAPMQPVAMQALDVGTHQNRTVRADLAKIATHEATHSTATPDVLQKKMQAIHDLVVQGERADAALLLVRLYIASEKGFLNMMAEDWARAEAKVDSGVGP